MRSPSAPLFHAMLGVDFPSLGYSHALTLSITKYSGNLKPVVSRRPQPCIVHALKMMCSGQSSAAWLRASNVTLSYGLWLAWLSMSLPFT